MPASLKTLLDPERIAIARARLAAWWEGEEFDAQAAREAYLEKAGSLGGGGAVAKAADSIFEPDRDPVPVDPRLQALEVLWGADRVIPGDALDENLHATRTGLPATGTLCVLGPGLAAPLIAMAEAHKGAFVVFEWREEAREVLPDRIVKAGLKDRSTLQPFDFDLFFAPAEVWDGLVSLDEFTYAPNPSRLAVQIAKGLKPGAAAVMDCYVAPVPLSSSSAFAASFSEPHVMAPEALRDTLTGAGLSIEDEEDLTDAHVALAKDGFRRLEEALSTALKGGLSAGVAREIAWEAESWGKRLAALSTGKLQRRRFIARRPD